jgi:AcrR family transcriptional regulator
MRVRQEGREGTGMSAQARVVQAPVAGVEGLRERKRAQARALTVDVALELFAQRGYEDVTVADICAAAEIAPRTFFRYFPTKEDVLAEPAREMAIRVEAAISAAPENLDEAEVIRMALLEIGEYVLTNRQRLAAFFRVATETPLVRSNPFVRLSDRERQISEHLVRRRPSPATPDWRTRLMVARAVTGFRIWLDDVLATDLPNDLPDPLAHLAEILSAP